MMIPQQRPESEGLLPFGEPLGVLSQAVLFGPSFQTESVKMVQDGKIVHRNRFRALKATLSCQQRCPFGLRAAGVEQNLNRLKLALFHAGRSPETFRKPGLPTVECRQGIVRFAVRGNRPKPEELLKQPLL